MWNIGSAKAKHEKTERVGLRMFFCCSKFFLFLPNMALRMIETTMVGSCERFVIL